MTVIDIKAARKWKEIPKEKQKLLVDNVFCSNCYVTTVVDYSLHDEEHGLILKGKCKQCGENIARLIEDA